jgi:rod shape determining protein RodA
MNNNIIARLDWLLILMYIILVTFGITNVYSSTYNDAVTSIFDLTQPVGKQIVFLGLSLFIGGLILAINVKFFEQFAMLSYIVGILLLIGLFVFGKTISGATSWYSFGGTSLQPSELVKVATALIIAKSMGLFQTDLKKPTTLLKIGCFLLLPAFLIVLQPDPGSAIIFGAFFFPLFREGLNYSYLFMFLGLVGLFLITLSFQIGIAIIIIMAVIAVLFYFIKKLRRKVKVWPFLLVLVISIGFSYSVDFIFNNIFEQRHRDRINIVLGKETDTKGIGYNINQSKIAIGSGEFSGKGFLKGTQTKGNFVPEQHTDYIFSTIGEEWGFVGGVLVIFLFCGLIMRIILSAEKQVNTFRRVFSYGVASLIFVHFLINIGMSLGMVPTIGIPLPFISYGGSSLLAFSILIFIHLNLDANRLNDW